MTEFDQPRGSTLGFGGLDGELAAFDSAQIVILPIPYDFTTSYQSGTRGGPRALLDASCNMELWDEEVGRTYEAGIHTLAELEPTAVGPDAMMERIEAATAALLDRDKLPVILGGEHSITGGAVRAFAKRYKNLSVLQIDAHADMRNAYLDSPYSHASVMRRVRELVPAVSVGIRSMSEEEAEFLDEHPAPIWSVRDFRALGGDFTSVLERLTGEVYVTFDLDGFDPSIIPATGTPEPGGLDWYETIDLLKAVSMRSRIVGFDVVELMPGHVPSAFAAARLTYRLMGLALASVSSASRKLGV